MNRLRRRIGGLLGTATAAVAVAVLLALTALPGGAQTASTDGSFPLRVESIDTSGYPTVKLLVSAPPELAGGAIPRSAFSITEDGRRRAVSATQLSNRELDVVLVIDTSGSMQGAGIAAAKNAADAFTAQVPADTRVAVVGFGDRPYVASPFDATPSERQSAVAGMQAAGETALYDALLEANKLLTGSSPTARKRIVVLSDGGDTRSVSSFDAVAAQLAVDGTRVYAVALATTETDVGALARIAESTGGSMALANEPAALAGLYGTIASDLSNQYSIEYESQARGGAELDATIEHAGVLARAQLTIDLSQPALLAPQREQTAPAVLAADPAVFDRSWTMVLGVVAVVSALALATILLMQPRVRTRRLAVEDGRTAVGGMKQRLNGATVRAAEYADRALERRGREESLGATLECAGVGLRPGEWTVLVVTSVVGASVLGFLLGGVLLALLLGGATYAGFRIALSVKTSKRRKAFAEQLGDTLQLLASSLRAGHSFMQAIDALAQESNPPTSDEFRRLVLETRLGRPVTDSLDDIAARVGNEDFSWIVQAVDIHREVGGDLAELLDRVAATIRDRGRVRRQVQTLSAEGRLSAIVLFILPFAVAALISIGNPDYLSLLTGTTMGKVMLLVGLGLLTVGGLWMRRLIRAIAY